MVATHLDFARLAREHPGNTWELHRGQMREKPPVVLGHERSQYDLMYQLIDQLDRNDFVVRAGAGRVASTTSYYIPDVFVLPTAHFAALSGDERTYHFYRQPLPLVVEIWSPSTGAYDIDEKLPEYIARGDAEIWRLHRFQRTLKAWRRRPDGGYDEGEFTGGTIALHALPGVIVDLEALFVPHQE